MLTTKESDQKKSEVFEICDRSFYCPVVLALSVLGGKWKMPLLWHLINEPIMRYGDIKRSLGKVTDKMLIQSLRELEADGIVIRSVEATVPPKVSYSLTEHGKEIKGIITQLNAFGMKYKKFEA